MAKSNASGLLTSLDSLFTTQEQRDAAKRDSVQDIPIFQISDFYSNLRHGIAVAHRNIAVFQRIKIHGNAIGRANFVLTTIALADVARIVKFAHKFGF